MKPELKLVMKKRMGRPRKIRSLIAESAKTGISPLEYMLAIMRDPNATESRRDRMAMMAAPYCHPKLAYAQPPGKKDQRAEAAATAGTGTEWANDLDTEFRAN